MRSARYFRTVGQGMAAFYRGTPRAEAAAERFYRRALRTLNGGTSNAGVAAAPGEMADGPAAAAVPLIEAVRQRTTAAWLGVGIWPRWRAQLPVVVGVAVLTIGVAAALPGVRQVLFPRDLAEGKRWTATSAFDTFTTKGVMTEPSRSDHLIIHTQMERFPAITIDLGRVERFSRVKVDNRTDCCQDRTQPLAIEVSLDGKAWKRVGYRRARFDAWIAKFQPIEARFVRARIDRVSMLHLRRIHVY